VIASGHKGQQQVLAQQTVHLKQKAEHEGNREAEQDVIPRNAAPIKFCQVHQCLVPVTELACKMD
jgi:hypothetical protein